MSLPWHKTRKCIVAECQEIGAPYEGPLCGKHHYQKKTFGKIFPVGQEPSRTAWNKGLTKKTDKRVARLAKMKVGKKNGMYKDGRVAKIKAIRRSRHCGHCKKKDVKYFEVHHKNGNREDNRNENLIGLCSSCHKKEHYRNMDRSRKGDVGGVEARRAWNRGLSKEVSEGVRRAADWKRGRKRESGTRRWLSKES